MSVGGCRSIVYTPNKYINTSWGSKHNSPTSLIVLAYLRVPTSNIYIILYGKNQVANNIDHNISFNYYYNMHHRELFVM